VLDCLPEGLAVCDAQGRVLLANEAFGALLGLTIHPGTVLGAAVAADPEAGAALAHVLESPAHGARDLSRPRERGEPRWLRLSAKALASAPDAPRVVMVHEVSDLKRAERDIWQVEKMAALGRLASSLAHEVGNPLSAIDIQLQLLQEDLTRSGSELAARSSRRVAVARTEMRRLEAIVRNFLRFSRPPALHLRTMSPNDLLAHIHALVEPEARERGICLALELHPDLPLIEVDENQLSQALLNVLINAFQAVAPGGHIALRSARETGQVLLEIADDGQGIGSEDLGRVFEFYYTTKDEGTGLGLSIAQRIVHQHEGTIEISSAPGRGTQVRVWLPLPGSSHR
jgi:two-component system sensor histidine kinase HydH/two-component system sensor histidine kinase AtoS